MTIGTETFERILFDSAIGGGNVVAAFFAPATTSEVKGIIQICHGMAEHMGRYKEMAAYLNSRGWHVCGMDMLGHGASYEANIERDMPLGYFGENKDAAMCILKDVMKFHDIIKSKYNPDGTLKMMLYGHSMGSFVVRNIYATPNYAEEFDRFIFSSTKGHEVLVDMGLFLSNVFGVFGQKKKPGKILNAIAFGAYNKRIPNNRTNFDWISTDSVAVDEYISDPYAAFLFTCKGFHDLFVLVKRQQLKNSYENSSLKPCMLTYGSEDPVGNYGKGPSEVASKLKNSSRQVVIKNYGAYRHEIQHEPEVKQQYFKDIDEFFSGSF